MMQGFILRRKLSSLARVFVELTTYIEQVVESGETVFKLSEIHSLYKSRLKRIRYPETSKQTRLKEKLLEHFVEHIQK